MAPSHFEFTPLYGRYLNLLVIPKNMYLSFTTRQIRFNNTFIFGFSQQDIIITYLTYRREYTCTRTTNPPKNNAPYNRKN